MSELKLLPPSAADFSSSDYWDSFFTKRKTDFEWYGEFDELAPLLRKFCSPKHSMLIVGCGSSNLSDRLYTDGYQLQLSIDISSIIINRMQKLYPHLVFKEDDVTNLHCADEDFLCVLDKGTFDALAPPPPKKHAGTPNSDAQPEEAQKSIQMLNEVQRVLKGGGRFVCISLLQSHVAELLIGYFINRGWMIKINRCEAAESRNVNSKVGLPVYVCLFLKPLKTQQDLPTQTFIEFVGLENGGKPQRLKTLSEVLECLKDEMTKKFYAAAVKTIGHFSNSGTEWTLCEENVKPKYKLTAVDVMSLTKNPVDKQMVIFIIPQGREMEYMFATHEGRTTVAKQMGFTRAVFVALQHDRQYPSLDEVQKEVGNHVQFVTPNAVGDAKVKIPIVTVDSDLGSCEIIHRGHSEFSGVYTVEDVKVGTNILRRLIFLNAPNLVQSEVALKVTTQKGKGQGCKQQIKTPVAHQLTSDYHGVMALAIPMLWFVMKQDENHTVETLVVGLGGGILVSFLHHYFPTLHITTLELDKEIVEVGRKYFGLQEHEGDGRLRIVVEDGLKFLKEPVLAGTKFDVIMFDVDNKSVASGLSCPPAEFLTDETLEATARALTPEGIFVVNFVCRNSALEEWSIASLSSHFPFIYKFKLGQEVNTVFFCFPKAPPGNSKLFSKSLKKSVQFLRDIQLNDITSNQKSKKASTHVVVDNQTEDTIVGLTDVGVEDLCAKFKIIRTKDM